METVQGYVILKAATFETGHGFALGHNPGAPSPFVTWQFTEGENGHRDYYWGRYGTSQAWACLLYTSFKWVFKTFVAVMILTNTFNIVLAVFDVSQHVIQQSAGIIQNGTEITDVYKRQERGYP